MAIPTTLKMEIFSLRKISDPMVVSKNTILTNIGYARDRSLNVRTLSQIKNDKPYKESPMKIRGLKIAFASSLIIFALSPEIPPIATTPFFKSIFATTLNETLVNNSWIKFTLKILTQAENFMLPSNLG